MEKRARDTFHSDDFIEQLKAAEDDMVVVGAGTEGKTEYSAKERREAELLLMTHLAQLQSRGAQEEEQKTAAVQKLLAKRPPRDHLQRERNAIEKRMRRNAKRAALVLQGKLK